MSDKEEAVEVTGTISQEGFQNKEIDLIATGALEVAAASPFCRDGAPALVSYAETILIGATVKLAIASGLVDVAVIHSTIDMLWDGARTGFTNASGGDC